MGGDISKRLRVSWASGSASLYLMWMRVATLGYVESVSSRVRTPRSKKAEEDRVRPGRLRMRLHAIWASSRLLDERIVRRVEFEWISPACKSEEEKVCEGVS